MKTRIEENRDFVASNRTRSKPESRIDLNDLLKRIKDKKEEDKKFNLLIVCSLASVAAIVLFVISF